MKKKAISLALVAMLAISAVGCSGNNNAGKATGDNQKTTVENVDILPENGQKIILENKLKNYMKNH